MDIDPNDLVPDKPPTNKWSLDFRIPIATIMAIIIWGLGGAWFLSSLYSDVGELKRQRLLDAPRLESVAKLEVKVDMLNQQVTELRQAQLDQFRELKQTIADALRR